MPRVAVPWLIVKSPARVVEKLTTVPAVKMPAVPVVVPAVRVGIVPRVILAVLAVKLAIFPFVLVRARFYVGTASATSALSLAAVTSFVTPSVNEVPAVKLAIV